MGVDGGTVGDGVFVGFGVGVKLGRLVAVNIKLAVAVGIGDGEAVPIPLMTAAVGVIAEQAVRKTRAIERNKSFKFIICAFQVRTNLPLIKKNSGRLFESP